MKDADEVADNDANVTEPASEPTPDAVETEPAGEVPTSGESVEEGGVEDDATPDEAAPDTVGEENAAGEELVTIDDDVTAGEEPVEVDEPTIEPPVLDDATLGDEETPVEQTDVLPPLDVPPLELPPLEAPSLGESSVEEPPALEELSAVERTELLPPLESPGMPSLEDETPTFEEELPGLEDVPSAAEETDVLSPIEEEPSALESTELLTPVEAPIGDETGAEETTVLEAEPTHVGPSEHEPTVPVATGPEPSVPVPTEHGHIGHGLMGHESIGRGPIEHEPIEPTTVLAAGSFASGESAEPTESSESAEPTAAETTLIETETSADGSSGGSEEPPPGLLDEMPAESSSGRGRKVLTGVGIGLVVLGAAYVGSVFYTADRTPPNASISGVEVGGMTSDEALSTVREALDARTTTAIPLTIGDVEATIQPEQAGLSYDPVASVERLTGRSWDPRVVWERFTGTVDVEAVTTVDTDALEGQLATAAEYVAVAPQDAVIVFADGRAVVTDPVDGAELDVPGAVDIISAEWLTAEGALDLPVAVVTPDLDSSDVDAAMTDIVEPMMSAPVTIQAGEEQLALEPATLTEVSSLVGVDGEFALKVDPAKIAETLQTGLPDLGGEPKDAGYEFVDGTPTIVPAVDGSGIDSEHLAEAVATAAVEPTGRVATAEFVTREPEFTTADAEALGPLQVVGEFSTPMPYDPPRTENLVIGTGKITGTIVMPGKEFSLLATIGPISSPPYNMSHGVDQGLVVDVAGGGLSQLSTTTFNAAYEAGMLDIEHRPHTRWFDRYPAGREATVNDPGLDMRWQNNTPYPVLMQAGVADSRTWVKLWSIPYWDVEIVSGNKHNFTSSKTIYNTQSSCKPESGGTQGFSINVTRTVSRDGVVDDAASGTLSWTYTAWPKVVCGPDPATLPPPAENTEPAGDQG